MGIWQWLKRFSLKALPAGARTDLPIAGLAAVWTDWSAEKAAKEGYKSSVWVFACVSKRANSVASVPLVVKQKQGDELVPKPDHPLQQLLNQPNPEMSQEDFLRLMVTGLDLGGNSYWIKVRDSQGRIMELWPAQTDNVTVIAGTDTFIAGYKFRTRPNEFIPRANMCHFSYVNPSTQLYGMSPLMAAGKAVDIDNASNEWQKISMQNRGVPDGVFSFDEMLTPEQYQEARKAVAEQHSGPSHARMPWVLSKAKFMQMSMTAVEMDFMESRRFTREEICSVYGVPSALIAEMGSVNLANSETARKLFWLDTVTPLLDQVLSEINLTITPEFGKDLVVEFDTSGIAALQTNLSEKLENARILWGMGVPFNDVNEKLELGFDEIPGGDTGYISAGVIPAAFDFSADQGDPPTDEELEKLGFEAYGRKRRGK